MDRREPSPTQRRPGERVYKIVACGGAALACLVGLYYFLRVPPGNGDAQEGIVPFANWGKPEVALLLSAQQHGYLQPCGCTSPQYGGLARRYNFIQSLKEKGWPVVAVDLGDIAEPPGAKRSNKDQAFLKYEHSMRALKAMDYLAVGFGKNEMSLPLTDAMAAYALNNPTPTVIGTNLATREKPGDVFHPTIAAYKVSEGKGPVEVGVLALVGPSVEKEVQGKDRNDPDLKFYPDTPAVLHKGLEALRGRGAGLNVILYQGQIKEAEGAAAYCLSQRKANPKYPPVHVVLCLCETDEPPSLPILVGDTMVIRLGHKGRYVGVVAAYRSKRAGQAWDLKYQLVSMGPQYQTPEAKESGHPILAVMERYAKDVKAQYEDDVDKGRFEKRQKMHPLQVMFKKQVPEFVGSSACAGCHRTEYDVWKKSGHAHAFETLESPKNKPPLKQYDPECLACHTVGFGYKTGFVHEKFEPKVVNKKNPEMRFKGVGCESCHGPGSAHIVNPRDMDVRKAMNPYRWEPNETAQQKQFRMNKIDMFCQTCHDTDNDANWKIAKWQQIEHRSPKRAGQAAKNGK